MLIPRLAQLVDFLVTTGQYLVVEDTAIVHPLYGPGADRLHDIVEGKPGLEGGVSALLRPRSLSSHEEREELL